MTDITELAQRTDSLMDNALETAKQLRELSESSVAEAIFESIVENENGKEIQFERPIYDLAYAAFLQLERLVEALEKSEKTSEARREAIDITHERATRERDRANAAEEALATAQAQSSKWLEAYHKAVSIGARYEERIAELEASHTKLRESMAAIHNTIRLDGAGTSLATILNAAKRAYEESASAAGIKLDVQPAQPCKHSMFWDASGVKRCSKCDMPEHENIHYADAAEMEITVLRQRIAELESFRTAYMEWSDKTDWVRTDRRFDVVKPLGKHIADVLKAYIEHLESPTFTFEVTAEPFTCPRCGTTTTHPEGWHYCHKREDE
ncbi:TPA: hypothetical protein ACHV25_003882 [Klebsiella pneumoniae]